MKDIYELFNELDIDFSDINEMQVNDLDRKKGKNKLMKSIKKRNSNRKKVIGVASVAIIALTSVSIIRPTWAQSLPIVGGLIQRTFLDSNPQFVNYINVIGQTNSYNGIDVTFENAVADRNNLILSYVVKDNNNPIEGYFNVLSPSMIVKINGEEVNTSGGADGEQIDDNTVRILQTINLKFEKIPKILDIEILDEERNMDIKFSMDTKEIENSTKTQSVNKKVNIDGDEINIDNVDFSPIMTKVYYFIKPKEVTGESKDDMKYYFWAFDQDDKELKWKGGRSILSDDSGVEECNDEYISKKDINKLTFIPIKWHSEEPKILESKKINTNNFEPISFNITDNIVLTVESLERDGDKVTIKYNYYYKGNKLYRVNSGNLFIKSCDSVDGYFEDVDVSVDDECTTVVYNIPQKSEIEIGCYDKLTNRILEDKAFSIDIK